MDFGDFGMDACDFCWIVVILGRILVISQQAAMGTTRPRNLSQRTPMHLPQVRHSLKQPKRKNPWIVRMTAATLATLPRFLHPHPGARLLRQSKIKTMNRTTILVISKLTTILAISTIIMMVSYKKDFLVLIFEF